MTTSGAKLPRVVVAGCGYWGANLVRNFASLGALVGIVDENVTLASQTSSKYAVPVLDWQNALADRSIDAVAIATPAESHARLVGQALAAGKHVFVEKPLALQREPAAKLVADAEGRGLTLMVGHLLQYHPAFIEMRALVQQGRLGRLRYIYSNRLNLGKVRREENILWSFAPHDISMILSLAGELPTSVHTEGSFHLHPAIADSTLMHMRFASGIGAHIYVSWLHPFKEQKLVVVGDQAMAVFDDGEQWDRKLTLYSHSIEWINGRPEPKKAVGEPVALLQAEPLEQECSHFLSSVASRSRPRTDGREGLAVLGVLEAGQRSLESGRTIEIEEIVGATKAAEPAADHFVHPSAVVDNDVRIGKGTRVWHFSHVLKNSNIGADCVIGQNACIGPDVSIGSRCKLQNNVSIYPGVTLEDGVFCGPSCVFTNVLNPRAEIERKNEFRPTLVKRGATIGANATIVCGSTVGEYALIAAGAVVTKDVPGFALMAGVPARRIGWVGHSGERLTKDLVCPREGRRYREVGPDKLEEIPATEKAS
ncbi:MAG: Gfo/Idh/MocA family oxidoreductase [Proteobacteria bacterium]|nr:Gfo/Idh/MocA family oxidoreductase [Pseudomonadota bacterium]